MLAWCCPAVPTLASTERTGMLICWGRPGSTVCLLVRWWCALPARGGGGTVVCVLLPQLRPPPVDGRVGLSFTNGHSLIYSSRVIRVISPCGGCGVTECHLVSNRPLLLQHTYDHGAILPQCVCCVCCSCFAWHGCVQLTFIMYQLLWGCGCSRRSLGGYTYSHRPGSPLLRAPSLVL